MDYAVGKSITVPYHRPFHHHLVVLLHEIPLCTTMPAEGASVKPQIQRRTMHGPLVVRYETLETVNDRLKRGKFLSVTSGCQWYGTSPSFSNKVC